MPIPKKFRPSKKYRKSVSNYRKELITEGYRQHVRKVNPPAETISIGTQAGPISVSVATQTEPLGKPQHVTNSAIGTWPTHTRRYLGEGSIRPPRPIGKRIRKHLKKRK